MSDAADGLTNAEGDLTGKKRKAPETNSGSPSRVAARDSHFRESLSSDLAPFRRAFFFCLNEGKEMNDHASIASANALPPPGLRVRKRLLSFPEPRVSSRRSAPKVSVAANHKGGATDTL